MWNQIDQFHSPQQWQPPLQKKEETDVLQNWGRVLNDYSKSEFIKIKMKEGNNCFTLFVKTVKSAYM